jgi:hypothetical protein
LGFTRISGSNPLTFVSKKIHSDTHEDGDDDGKCKRVEDLDEDEDPLSALEEDMRYYDPFDAMDAVVEEVDRCHRVTEPSTTVEFEALAVNSVVKPVDIYTPCEVDGYSVMACVDSGSHRSLISRSFCEHHGIKRLAAFPLFWRGRSMGKVDTLMYS